MELAIQYLILFFAVHKMKVEYQSLTRNMFFNIDMAEQARLAPPNIVHVIIQYGTFILPTT